VQCKNCGQDNPPEARFCGNCGAALVAIAEPSPPAAALGPAPTPLTIAAEYVGFWLRFGAWILDIITISLIGAVIGTVRGLAQELGLVFVWGLVEFFLLWIYFWLFTGLNKGRTLGKMLVGIKVVKAHGEAPGLGYAALREVVGKTISWFALCLGLLWIAWDKEKQSWHDKIASTYVVKAKSRS
jgi:uncharacterized RDD family membrane protein YckC